MASYTIVQISDKLKQDIMVNLIEPGYKLDIEKNLKLKKKYANAGLLFESMSKIFIGVSSITSFSAGIYKYQILAFLAGAGSVLSLMFLQFSSYSFRESKLISDELNKILRKLNMDTMPDPLGSSENAPQDHQQNNQVSTTSPPEA